jgi:hypothetical protein
MTVSGSQRRLELSSSTLLYVVPQDTRADQSPNLDQSIQVLATGGPLDWTARVVQGADWIVLRNTSGVSGATDSSRTLSIGVNPGGRPPGLYEGLVLVESPGADNSPSGVRVQLDLRARGANLGPSVFAAGLVFTAAAGGEPPLGQEFRIFNFGRTATNYTASFAPQNLRLPMAATLTPVSGRLGTLALTTPSPFAAVRVSVSPGSLPAGIHRGVVLLQFDDGITRTVNVVLVLSSGDSAADKAGGRDAAGCTAQALTPVFTSVEDGLRVATNAWNGDAVSTQLAIVDDCGNLARGLAVGGRFSNGDRAVEFRSLGAGHWQTTWQAQTDRDLMVQMDVTAVDPARRLQGSQGVRTFVRSTSDGPVIRRGGIVDDETRDERQLALTPGRLMAIRGARLADEAETVNVPSTTLGGVTVLLGGNAIELASVSPEEIVARLPVGLTPHTTHQVVVLRDGRITLPETIVVGGSK